MKPAELLLFYLGVFAYCIASFTRPSHAQSAQPTSASICFPSRSIAIDHWRGEYFNNPTLGGPAVMLRDDGVGSIDFDWGLEGPSKECGVKVDEFSVRWTRVIAFGGGAYQFSLTSDDGLRLLIDGKEKFSHWADHPLTTDTIEIALTPGNHKITFEYYERLGSAIARLSWKEHPCVANVAPDRWRGEYFNNDSLSGAPAMVRDEGDKALLYDRNLMTSVCVTTIGFSVRWSRKIAFGKGFYRFFVIADSGVRISIDGKLLLDQWRNESAGPFYFDAALDAGNHLVGFEYRRGRAPVQIGLNWETLPCFADVPADRWRGEYFNNDSLHGDATMVRNDGARGLDFNWGDAAPAGACGVRPDNFSSRWTSARIFAGGIYRFSLSGSGGVKFLIDGESKFDRWRPAAFKESFEVELGPGTHQLLLEYSDLGARAAIRLEWLDPPCVATAVAPDRWRAEYFDNKDLAGRPSVVRNEGLRMIDFAGGLQTPQPDCADFRDQFSARWSRIASFEATTYRFTVTADDGVRLLVDNRPIIDQWHDQAETTYTADIEMTAGKHRVVLEYYNQFGASRAHLVWAAAPCAAVVPEKNWRGEFFNNTNLAGKPSMTRNDGDGAIDFDWGLSGPESSCGLQIDNFSARWTRTVLFGDGLYRFSFKGDDGVRIFLDDKLVLDRWAEQMAVQSFEMAMTAGNHRITVEYFERWGSAAIQFSWARHPCFADVPPDHWHGEYFNHPALGGSPALIRDDGDGGLNFDWGPGNPSAACNLKNDDFSVRWSRKVIFDTGWQRFTLTADDGFRLFVDGRKVIDAWRNQLPATLTADIHLAAGSHRIVVEYYERSGSAKARLDWQGAPSRK